MAGKQLFEQALNNLLRNLTLHEKHYNKLKILEQLLSNCLSNFENFFFAQEKTTDLKEQCHEDFAVLGRSVLKSLL